MAWRVSKCYMVTQTSIHATLPGLLNHAVSQVALQSKPLIILIFELGFSDQHSALMDHSLTELLILQLQVTDLELIHAT